MGAVAETQAPGRHDNFVARRLLRSCLQPACVAIRPKHVPVICFTRSTTSSSLLLITSSAGTEGEEHGLMAQVRYNGRVQTTAAGGGGGGGGVGGGGGPAGAPGCAKG